MANNIKAKVSKEKRINVSPHFVLNNGNGLQDIQDIDLLTNPPVQGSVLVYDSSLQKWQSTLNLYRQDIDAGEF